MNENIKPLKKLPKTFKLGGDYNFTQSALILGLLAKAEISIRNYNRGKDTSYTISFLDSIGCTIERSATEIVVKTNSIIKIDECAELEYMGGAVPLTQIIGYLAGRNICCSLKYANNINPDLIDLLISHFNKFGVDIFHESDSGVIYFRSYTASPIECTLSESLPYLKNCLLFYSLTIGQSIAIKEKVATDNQFEKLITGLGGGLLAEETKSVMTVDPDDPRKKIRVVDFDYKRKIDLAKSSKLDGGELNVPSDFHSLAAFILLATLKKENLTVQDVSLNESLSRYIRFLKSFTADVELSNKKSSKNITTYDLVINGREAKGRKLAGRMASALMELTPYISIAAAIGNGNTVIRDIAEYAVWQNNPFSEITMALKNLGIKSGNLEDGLVIEGKADYEDDNYGPFVNRETALAFYMLTLAESARTNYKGFEIVADNYPEVVEAVQTAFESQLLSRSA